MIEKPWYQKRQFDPGFPFDMWQTSMTRGFSLHWHELVEIVYVISGEMHISLEGQDCIVRKGDIAIINSGLVHGYSNTGAESGNSIFIIQFGLELFDQANIDLRNRVFQHLILGKLSFSDNREGDDIHRRLEQSIFSMNREFYERQEGFHLAIKARLYDLALVLLRSVPARQVSESELIRRNLRNQVLNKIFSYIHENFDQDISLEEAAASVHLSKFYFSRFFRSQTGQTFHAYLNRVRISHAEDLLADTELPVTEVAYQSGFGSIKTFNRQFRAATGTSPSRYRAGER